MFLKRIIYACILVSWIWIIISLICMYYIGSLKRYIMNVVLPWWCTLLLVCESSGMMPASFYACEESKWGLLLAFPVHLVKTVSRGVEEKRFIISALRDIKFMIHCKQKRFGKVNLFETGNKGHHNRLATFWAEACFISFSNCNGINSIVTASTCETRSYSMGSLSLHLPLVSPLLPY